MKIPSIVFVGLGFLAVFGNPAHAIDNSKDDIDYTKVARNAVRCFELAVVLPPTAASTVAQNNVNMLLVCRSHCYYS